MSFKWHVTCLYVPCSLCSSMTNCSVLFKNAKTSDEKWSFTVMLGLFVYLSIYGEDTMHINCYQKRKKTLTILTKNLK